jgi:hypothetical protein
LLEDGEDAGAGGVGFEFGEEGDQVGGFDLGEVWGSVGS